MKSGLGSCFQQNLRPDSESGHRKPPGKQIQPTHQPPPTNKRAEMNSGLGSHFQEKQSPESESGHRTTPGKKQARPNIVCGRKSGKARPRPKQAKCVLKREKRVLTRFGRLGLRFIKRPKSTCGVNISARQHCTIKRMRPSNSAQNSALDNNPENRFAKWRVEKTATQMIHEMVVFGLSVCNNIAPECLRT